MHRSRLRSTAIGGLVLVAGILAPSNAIAALVPSTESGLVGLWHFDEGSGTSAVDSSGAGLDGAIIGATYVLSGGLDGTALQFECNGYVDLSYSALLIDYPLTVEVWINPETLTGTVFSSGTGSFPRIVFGAVGSRLQLYTRDSYYYSDSGVFTRGQWHHIVISRDATGAGDMYVNGVDVGDIGLGSPFPGSGTVVRIGGGEYLDGFNGRIDEVAVYDRALSAAEIADHYIAGTMTGAATCGNGVVEAAEMCDDGNTANGDGCSVSCKTEITLGCPSGMVGYWRFDEGSGTLANDSYAGAVGAIHGATWAAGLGGPGLDFAGAQYVDVTSCDLDFSFPITVETWIKLDSLGGNIFYSGTGSYPQMSIVPVSSGYLRVYTTDQYSYSDTAVLSTGVWQHVAVTRYIDGSGDMYVDGMDVGDVVGDHRVGNGTRVWIGGGGLDGRIDEFAMYDRALTPIEISNLYLSGSSAKCTGEAPNAPPVANGGPDQLVIVGNGALLDGSGSHDPDNDDLNYAWTLLDAPAGSTAILVDASAVVTTLTPDLAGTYLIALVVNDGLIDSAPDLATITAQTPLVAVEDLVEEVDGLGLQGNQLSGVLKAAQKVLSDANGNNDVAAINSLRNFIVRVEDARGDPLSDAEADELIALAQAIIGSLT